ncbi:hypothetical protein ACLOJK_019546 [Asimina triloba]
MVDCLWKSYREISRQQTLSLLHVLSGFDYDGDNMVITDKMSRMLQLIFASFIGDEDLEDYKLVVAGSEEDSAAGEGLLMTDPHPPSPTSAPPRVIYKVHLAGAATESIFSAG